VRIRLAAKAVTPPVIWNVARHLRRKVRGERPIDAPAPSALQQPDPPAPLLTPAGGASDVPPDEPVVEQRPPEWEHVPEGWARAESDPRVKGWNVEAIADAYRSKWPSYLAALEGAKPLGVYHEVVSGDAVSAYDHSAHNMLVSYAYVLARAAHGKDRISILDWGGGIGHYYPLSTAVLPGVEIDYHCKDVPVLCELGRELFPDARFYDDDSCLDGRYDLVLASGALQYAVDWRSTLGALARAAAGHLYVTRLPIAKESPSFVVVQRAYAYGYDTEYLGWVINRQDLLAEANGAGAELQREFLLSALFDAAGAPERPTEHRGYLFAAPR
jgi:putative methyltransferase (TIGR04325 family)